ncbi:phage minor head protein [uncultured Porphyromonas sp.]|uniref:phage minor head protein n=1 Tax=uncultured Porphyromonas sp. TaxID=159274 RepID=UPI002805AC93|nr:phage minor head protein [uncultured Porphyromonas sp.]
MTPEMLRERPIRRLISETAGVYLQALDDKSIQYEIPDEMRQSLEQDIFVFSGFKTYHQLKEASELLRDSQGRVKSFNKFYEDVSAIRDKYNRNWLHAEYNFAVSSAQMASHWAEYQQDEEMANLQYRTALDDKVRPEHAALEGVTLPMSDPFWDTAFPPNGWNCRCHVIPVLKEDFPLSNSQRAQDAYDDMTQGKASIFRYNPGKEGVIFPPHHPYYGKRGYKHCLNPHLATSLGDNLECDIIYNIQHNEGNIEIPTEKGKVVETPWINKNERDKNINTAKYLANTHGYEIYVLSDVEKKEGSKHSADSYNATLKRFEEYKHIEKNTFNSFDRNLRKAAKQANNVVFVINGDYNKGDLKDAIKNRFNAYEKLESIRIIHNYETDILISRDAVITGDIPL